MKKITLLSAMALLCLNFAVTAQQTATEIKPLKIGQKIPLNIYEQVMSAILNKGRTKDSIRLSQYKDKIILLDFWASWCSSCIYKFPKLDSLQEKYKKDLAIVLVNTKSTKDTPIAIEGILSGAKAPFRSTGLLSIYGDTLLNKLFPHPYLPHYVWIGKDGVLKAMGDSSILNEDTLNAVLKELKFTKKPSE